MPMESALPYAGTGDRVLDEFNQSTLDKVGDITTVSGLAAWR